MFKTLRYRLILSHILPLVITLPLLGIASLYVLERLVYIPSLTNEIEGDAHLLAQIMAGQPDLWGDPLMAMRLLSEDYEQGRARVMMLSSGGDLVASSDPLDKIRIGQPIDLQGGEAVLNGEPVRQVHYSQSLHADVIDVYVPVYSAQSQLLGALGITYQYATLSQEFYQLRYVVAGIIIIGILVGSAIGYLLGVSIEAPILEVTEAVEELAEGYRTQLVRESGPLEIYLLAVSVNHLVIRLRELEASRKQLLANLVHELGRPLGALRSAIQALSMGAEKDAVFYRELLAGMEEESDGLGRLLEDLAHLHDQFLGPLELDLQELHLDQWLPTVLRTWETAARQRQQNWSLDIPAAVPLVRADPVRLAQVVGNLASNAIKFTPVGGSVRVALVVETLEVGIIVSDSGSGILEEDLEQIFKPFFRGANAGRFLKGMGLGLSIARDLVEAHGGRLEVLSRPGDGSRFSVWLPVFKNE